jgi:hypothetical protein
MDTIALLGSTMGLGMVAGMRLYATVLTIGLGVRFGLITLSPEMSNLSVLADTYILIAAGIGFLLEFFADKIPWVDSLWDSINTFIRPIGAAVLGATAVGSIGSTTSILAGLICGGTAFSSHATKAGIRFTVNHSPEPFSNIALSLSEDIFGLLGIWLLIKNPVFMLGVVAFFLLIFIWISPKLFRMIKVEILALLALIKAGFSLAQSESITSDDMPEEYSDHIRKALGEELPSLVIKCIGGKGVKRLRNSIGYLCLTNNQFVFIARKWFRFRARVIDRKEISNYDFKKKLLLDRLSFVAKDKRQYIYFFKDSDDRPEKIYNMLMKSI